MAQSGKSNFVPPIVIAVVVILAIVIGARYGNRIPGLSNTQTTQSWYAVALDGGAIYFGQVHDQNHQYVNLTNVYVAQQNPNAQTTPTPTASSSKSTPTPTASSTEPAYLLQKLSLANIYGPENSMQINRDHILFIQKLAADSQVIKTIQQDK